MTMPPPGWIVEDFGLRDYDTVLALQLQAVEARLTRNPQRNPLPNLLLLGEHPPVITAGRKTPDTDLLHPTLPVKSIGRGGSATLHAPGQLVAYPIMQLPEGQRDLHRYLRQLETVIIHSLTSWGITGLQCQGKTGVWVQATAHPSQASLPDDPGLLKIASIGVAVRRWVTYHGIALNLCNDLSLYSQIAPCGFSAEVMTSVTALQQPHPLPASQALMQEAKTVFTQAFLAVFQPNTY